MDEFDTLRADCALIQEKMREILTKTADPNNMNSYLDHFHSTGDRIAAARVLFRVSGAMEALRRDDLTGAFAHGMIADTAFAPHKE